MKYNLDFFKNMNWRQAYFCSYILFCISQNFVSVRVSPSYIINKIDELNLTNNEIDSLIFYIENALVENELLEWCNRRLLNKIYFCFERRTIPIIYCEDFFKNYLINYDCNFTLSKRHANHSNNENILVRKNLITTYSENKSSPNRIELLFTDIAWERELEQKKYELQTIKNNFLLTMLDEKALDWLDSKNKMQLNWAYDYLKKNSSHFLHLNIAGLDYNLLTGEESYEWIIAYIQTSNLFGYQAPFFYEHSNLGKPTINDAVRKLAINKFRQAWNQKVFRDKKTDETAIEFLLYKKSFRRLKEMSAAYGSKPVEFLENLIEKEYKSYQQEKNQ